MADADAQATVEAALWAEIEDLKAQRIAAVAEVDRQWCENIDKCTDGELAPAVDATISQLRTRIAELEHTITQYLDSHGTAGTGELGKRLKAAVGRVEGDRTQTAGRPKNDL